MAKKIVRLFDKDLKKWVELNAITIFDESKIESMVKEAVTKNKEDLDERYCTKEDFRKLMTKVDELIATIRELKSTDENITE